MYFLSYGIFQVHEPLYVDFSYQLFSNAHNQEPEVLLLIFQVLLPQVFFSLWLWYIRQQSEYRQCHYKQRRCTSCCRHSLTRYDSPETNFPGESLRLLRTLKHYSNLKCGDYPRKNVLLSTVVPLSVLQYQ